VLISAADKFPAAGLAARVHELEQAGQTVIIVVQDGTTLGMLALRDTLRDDAKAAMADLHQIGVQGVILTGDNPRAAAALPQS
jgi:Cd2+/Zn2+-exporting ATPase